MRVVLHKKDVGDNTIHHVPINFIVITSSFPELYIESKNIPQYNTR